MDSLLIGSHNYPVELLRIETNQFNLYLQGRPSHPTVEMLRLHRKDDSTWVDAHLHIQAILPSLEITSIKLFSPEEQGLVPWQFGYSCPPLFYEAQTYELIVEMEPNTPITFHHDNVNLRQSVLPKGGRLLSGMLNFQNEVGFTELELRLHGESLFRMQLEIFPSKMDYKQDYQTILNDVNTQVYNLSFDFLRKTYHFTGLKETRNQSLTELFTILQHVFQQLIQNLERMHNTPHHRMIMENRIVESSRVKKAGRENIAFLAKRPHLLVAADRRNGLLRINDQGYMPSHVLETRRSVDYDTPENRFVRWVLVRVQTKLRIIKTQLGKKERSSDPHLLKKVVRMQKKIERFLQLDFLQVGDIRQMTTSLVLQMAPGYRDIYKFYLILMKGLAIQNDLFRLSMKDLAQLYEYWCFLKIHELLSRKYELVKQDIIKLNRSGLFVKLKRGNASKIVYRHPQNGEEFILYYNALPSGDGSRTTGQQPDNVLTLKKRDSTVEYKYIFDAKYRINPAYEGTSYQRKYKEPGPQEEDINTMHRYRDAIVAGLRADDKELERSMFGAYVLFPYADEQKYQEHHFYKSIDLVNVGAFPLLPNSTSLLETFLDEIILDSPEKAYERSTQPRGTKEYYADKLAGQTVLVGALSHENQLRDLRRFGFYHVPLQHFSKHGTLSQLEYVAIYQSIKRFGREQAGITLYGKVKTWKVLPRHEIHEIPSRRGATNELYVKLTVEEWLEREERIVPGGHGVKSVLLTSKYIFDRAVEVAELRLETEAQLRDWREKRRQGKISVKWDDYHVDRATRLESLELGDEVGGVGGGGT
ncbi:restriction endonuclease-like protein [Paenibacillus taiwanensis]|uniref:restriction endonuclease-like protein n=1 Tax=Paenibacillus taiwanensis TaxID=401638 RepID=UPI00048C79C1|nr:restriction endonuclease-like protein [Paenibacillus taiwanensis]